MNFNKGISIPLITIIVAVVLVGGGATYYYITKLNSQQKPVACTQEAKVCPDGSTVGRTGYNCEFAPCPKLNTSQTSITVLPLLSGATVANGDEVHVIWKTQGNVGNIGIGFCPQNQQVGGSSCTPDVNYDNTGDAMVGLSGQLSLSQGNWVVHVIDITNRSVYGVDNGYFTVKGGPLPLSKDCNVKTYQDKFYSGVGEHCLDKIVIKGVYFVAKNQTTGIKSYWKDNMQNILTQIKNFYESQFNNRIQIIVDTPIMIYGDNNIEQYGQYLIEREIRKKISIDKSNFAVIMFYPIQGEGDKRVVDSAWGGGGEVDNSSSAMNSWFWIDPDMMKEPDYQGALLSAHEFGHALGIPHPWDEEVNKYANGKKIDSNYGNDEIGSLMSYSGQKGPLIPNSFIREDVKNKMIVKK